MPEETGFKVFYEQVYADNPNQGLPFIEADTQPHTINVCPIPIGKDPYTLANQLLRNFDPRVAVGCVGCIDLTGSTHDKRSSNKPLWLFFGWEMS